MFVPLVTGPGSTEGAVFFIIIALILMWVWAFVRAVEIAQSKGRRRETWRLLALMFGPLAVAAVSVLRSKARTDEPIAPEFDDPVT